MTSKAQYECNNSECEDQTDDARMQQYKAEVTRKLLENFNLEDTLDTYRDMSKAKLKIDPADFSFDSSLAATRMRNRLIELMGTDEVGMSDLAYVQKLRKKIWEEYEKQLDRDEMMRSQAEKARLRRLMLEGVITADDLRNDPCMLQEYQQHMTKLKFDMRRGTYVKLPSQKKPRRRKRKRHSSGKHTNDKDDDDDDDDDEDNDVLFVKEISTTQKTNGELNVSQTNTGLFSGSITTVKLPDERRVSPDMFRRWPRHTSPLLEQLRREETLDGLYSVAEKIILKMDGESGKKKH